MMVNGHTPFEQWNEWSNNVSSKSTPTMSEMLWEGGRQKKNARQIGWNDTAEGTWTNDCISAASYAI